MCRSPLVLEYMSISVSICVVTPRRLLPRAPPWLDEHNGSAKHKLNLRRTPILLLDRVAPLGDPFGWPAGVIDSEMTTGRYRNSFLVFRSSRAHQVAFGPTTPNGAWQIIILSQRKIHPSRNVFDNTNSYNNGWSSSCPNIGAPSRLIFVDRSYSLLVWKDMFLWVYLE